MLSDGLMLGQRRRRWPNIKPALGYIGCSVVQIIIWEMSMFDHISIVLKNVLIINYYNILKVTLSYAMTNQIL